MAVADAHGTRRRIAVIGAGVAGLTAAHALRQTHEVVIFEADHRLGGHAHTQDITDRTGQSLAIDTGFIVHNRATYPTLLRLFADLGVQTQATEMSMSVWCHGCGLQYAGGKGGSGLIAQPARLLDPRYLQMLAGVSRFHRAARELLADESAGNPTLGEFLAQGRWSHYTIHHFMIPVVAAVWSCAPGDALLYPARYLFAFLANHGMLSVSGSPQWFTVVGGSRSYVEKAAKDLAGVHTGTPVRELRRVPGGVEIIDGHSQVHRADGVVVATHPAQALALLADATPAEHTALSAFSYSTNPTVLHTSTGVLPPAQRARASWNYTMPACDAPSDQVLVSYDMTRLQRLTTDTTYVVSLNPQSALDSGTIAPSTVLRSMVYEHPVYTPESVAAQALLPALNNSVTTFAGAWHGWGFHEDGARAGLAAATALGATW